MEFLAGFGHVLSVWFLPVVTAITLHEAAHAFAAYKLGDDTAKRLGRVSFNPLRHIDLTGTLLLPGLLLLGTFFGGPNLILGWAKPVPVAFHHLRNPKHDMIWVALAGPGINIALAVVVALLMHLVMMFPQGDVSFWVWTNLDHALFVNVLLACFNMLPILPLDGGRVVKGLLPGPLSQQFGRLERFGFFILIGFFILLPFAARQFGYEFNLPALILFPAIEAVHGLILSVTGW